MNSDKESAIAMPITQEEQVATTQTPLLETKGLTKFFTSQKGWLNRQKRQVRALDGVDLTINEQETLGVVGESGCGKTTLGRVIMWLTAPTSGQVIFDGQDTATADKEVLKMFPENETLMNWIKLAEEKIPWEGLPSRVCWLGYGERVMAGLRFNEMVASGELKAPIVIGRDHLDAGSVASPNRETEGMLDGTDAVSDWPLLNAMLNAIGGATWVSFHHGGGVGIGYSQHAGQVIVADGTPEAAARINRVLTTDPGTGIVRHADAGYEEAIAAARHHKLKMPMLK